MGAARDLAFLIHFVGDIHQPLHTTTNADRGGTCQRVNVTPAEENLHYAWDDAVVVVLEKQLGTHDQRPLPGSLSSFIHQAQTALPGKLASALECSTVVNPS
jgi:hypothetical protein